ncbi:unnamed protein product [Cylindrotheca closterium]|uniref:Calmodulin-lysine N-methyltransferase n=1 Tax=Cylindrotheca closterium TaxID=2856 RepID=A0AAD2CKB4_9STRA|nr:unnamed protein product [Cylindrotheca closterium]
MSEQEETAEFATTTHPTAKAFFDALDTRSSSSRQSLNLRRRVQSLGWRNRHSQAKYYPCTVNGIGFSVKQVQRGEVDGTYGTGATVWPAALVLIKYLERNPSLLQGKKVADLGSGTGITSVASALLGASIVICTDGEDSVVQLAESNLQHVKQELTGDVLQSFSSEKFSVQRYWWGDDSMMGHQDCEVIIVADCVLPKLYPIAPLVQAIDELLVSPTSVAILSYEHRYYPDYHPRSKFEELATQRGLLVEQISGTKLDPVYSVDDIEIWHVTRRE